MKQRVQPSNSYCLLFTFIPILALAPWGIAAGCLLVGLDASYFISEHYMTSPMYRSMNEMYASWVIRFVIVLWPALEFARTTCFCLIGLVMYTNRLYRISRRFIKREGNPQKMPHEYNCMSFIWTCAQAEIEGCLYFVLTPIFWTIVLLVWLLVRSSSAEITPFFYNLVFIAAFAMIFYTAILLPILCKLLDNCLVVIAMQQFYTKWLFFRKHNRARRWEYLKAKALKPVVIKYGPYWRLGRQMAIQYFWIMFQRTSDAILAFRGA